MALGTSLNSFVDGLFSGAKTMNELVKARNDLTIQQQNMDFGAAARNELENAPDASATRTPGTAPDATSGSSTPPATTAPSATANYNPPEGHKPGEDFLDKAPLIQQYENVNADPYLGTGGHDLKAAPTDPITGFPIWDGIPTDIIRNGKRLNSTAAGLFQITKETWDPIAKQLGIKDFSPTSQWRVAEELYNQRGLQPWMVGNASFANAVKQGAAGGGYAAMTGGAPPSARLTTGSTGPLPQVPNTSSALGQNYTTPPPVARQPVVVGAQPPPQQAGTLRTGIAPPAGAPTASGVPPGYVPSNAAPGSPGTITIGGTTYAPGSGDSSQSALDPGAGY